MFKIISVKRHNILPVEEVQAELDALLGDGWKVVSENTVTTVASVLTRDGQLGDTVLMAGTPWQVIHTITIILEKV